MHTRTRGEANFGRSSDGHELHRMRELTREEAGFVSGGGVIIIPPGYNGGVIANIAKAYKSVSVTSTYTIDSPYNFGGSAGASGANG